MTTKSNGHAGEMGGLIKIETITPAMARELLKRDSKNRTLGKRLVTRYAAEMTAGDWQMNGETIKIAVNGDVLDGQHRLHACVLSNSSFPCVLVYDLPTEVFRTIDSGKARTLADLLHLRGVTDGKTIASAAAYVWGWDTSPPTRKVTGIRPHAQQRPTRNQLFKWLETTNFGLWLDSTKAAYRMRGICTGSIACAAHYIMSRGNRAKADEFFVKFASGAGLSSDGDPVLVLRNRMVKDRAKKIQTMPNERFLWIMKAWTAFLEGREIRNLRVRTKGHQETIGSIRGDVDERPAA